MTVNNSSDNLLEVRDLSISIWEGDASYTAVDGISYEVKKGEILGIIGKNGSGKSTMLKALAGIFCPDSGTIDLKACGYGPSSGGALGFGRKHPLRREGAYRDFGCRAQKPERK